MFTEGVLQGYYYKTMERSNNIQFNPSRYEDHLSVFGKKVLNVLVRKWNSDKTYLQNSEQNCRRNIYQTSNRRVLTFRDDSLPSQTLTPAPMICHDIDNIVHDEQPFDFNLNQNVYSHSYKHDVPTTSQLIQTFDTSEKTGDNLITPVEEGRIPDEIQEGIMNIDDLFCTGKSSDNNAVNHADGVDWDNMFDTELFLSEAAIDNAQLALEQTKAQTSNKLITEYPFKAKKTLSNNMKRKSDNPNNNDCKKSKRKNLTTDCIQKKVKKVPVEPRINFRKEKYTKTIKNWLTDVDPSRPVEINEDTNTTISAIPQTEISIEKVREKTNKKVVQAKLTNKNGTMKYKKPDGKSIKILEGVKTDKSTPLDENNIVKRVEEPENNKIDEANKSAEKNKAENNISKKLKVKPKFIAPIKSQIPVRNVEFQVSIIEENDTDENLEKLSKVENEELVLVLIYSNGFCQLNYHHTEDMCDPEGFIIKIGENFFYFKKDRPKYRKIIQTLLEKNKIVCYEGKLLLIFLKSKLDIDVNEMDIVDAKIGGSILVPDNPPENFSELQKLLSYTPQFTIATECILQKAAWYTTLLKECSSKLVYLLKEEQLWNVFTNIEMKLLPIIAEMERRGIRVDLRKLKSMEEILLTKMKATELECHKAAGRVFQINSPVQVRALIYDELKLDAKCNMKIRETLAQGAKSTSESMLRGLVPVHPLPRLILEYRHLHKAHATFLAGIAQHVKDGIVRPTWVQTAAATGRIASNNPNLQAIPKVPFNLMLFPELSGVDITECEALSFRSIYVPRDGHVLVACDFKHVECRVFAHAAADDRLLAALRTGDDLFTVLAHTWLKKAESEVSGDDRERTKRIVYATLYGAGVRRLADMLAVSYEHALAVRASFDRTFPSLKSFGQSVVSRCAESGGRLTTLCGRARRFNNIASNEFALKSQAERQAVNFVVQGSAADLCKLAMVEACSRLRRHSPPLEARLLLQIHDELVWEVTREHLHGAVEIIKRAMEDCGPQSGMEDKLPVAIFVGENWGEIKEYRTDTE